MTKLQVALIREKSKTDSLIYKLEGIELAALSLSSAEVGLLVAPEYHFRNPNATSVKDYHINKNTKDIIKEFMIKLSTKYPNVVMIPGTVAWKQPAVERLDLLTSITSIGPSFFSSTNNNQIGSNEKFNLVSTFGTVSSKPLTDILYNTAYIYHDGDWYGMDKEGDFQESSSQKVLVHEKGTLVRQLRVGRHDIRIGLEICLDHNMGRLRSYLNRTREADVDVHILMSDFVLNTPSNFCARRGGVVVHASTVDRFLVDTSRYEYVNFFGTWQLWDSKKSTYTTKSTVAPKSGASVTSTPVPPLLPGMPWTVKYSHPAQHNKRVTNVFKHTQGGQLQSQKVSHSMGHFFKVVSVTLD